MSPWPLQFANAVHPSARLDPSNKFHFRSPDFFTETPGVLCEYVEHFVDKKD